MKMKIAIGLAALLFASPVSAVTYHDSDGTAVQAFVPLGGCVGTTCGGGGAGSSSPYAFTPLSPDQHNLAITSATTLTIPTGALFAEICAKTASVNYTWDGATTPTSSIGFTLAVGACVWLQGSTMLSNFKAISATGTLDVGYAK